MKLQTTNDDHCFCCGKLNDRGLKLSFTYPDENSASTTFVIPEYFTGWADITHGGFISMLLDETMAHACLSRNIKGFTGELTVKFTAPLPVGTKAVIEGRIEGTRGRIVFTRGKITDYKGTVYAEGKAKFFQTS